MKITALWHESATTSTLRAVASDEISQEGLIQVKSLFSMISSGTERLVACGKVPENLTESMKVPYQKGSLSLPVNYGYSMVGEVISKGHALFGKKVHFLHPHQDYCWIQAEDAFVIPDTVSPQKAALASNMETVVNAIWDSGVSVGDRVLVAGLGSLGALLALTLSRIPAIEIEVIENRPDRQKWAEDQGIKISNGTHTQAFDMAFHTTGNQDVLQTCLDAVGFEGKAIELSWYGNKSTSIQLGGSFHQQRKQIISSQVGHIPAHRANRWDFRRRKEVVFDLLQNEIYDQLEIKVHPFSQTPALFDQIRQQPELLPMINLIAY